MSSLAEARNKLGYGCDSGCWVWVIEFKSREAP